MEKTAEQSGPGVAKKYQISNGLWNKMKPLLPPPRKKKKDGRPRMDDRRAMNAIVYVLRTGCQWNAIPRSLGASSTVHDRFQEWVKDGVFRRFWKAGLMEYDEMEGIDGEWQAMDGAMTKAPLGGKRNGSQSDGPGQRRDKKKSAD